MKWYHWIGWGLFLLSCIFEGYFFMVSYKKPISMESEIDSVKITHFLQEEHNNSIVKNIRIGGKFPVTGLFKDLVLLKKPDVNIENIKSVFYEVETDTSTYHYVTLFDVEHKFMREEVGEILLTGRNYFLGLEKRNKE